MSLNVMAINYSIYCCTRNPVGVTLANVSTKIDHVIKKSSKTYKLQL